MSELMNAVLWRQLERRFPLFVVRHTGQVGEGAIKISRAGVL